MEWVKFLAMTFPDRVKLGMGKWGTKKGKRGESVGKGEKRGKCHRGLNNKLNQRPKKSIGVRKKIIIIILKTSG